MRLHRHEHQRVASSLSRRLGRTGAHAERTSGVRSRMRHLLSHNPRHARGSGGDTSPSRLTHIPQLTHPQRLSPQRRVFSFPPTPIHISPSPTQRTPHQSPCTLLPEGITTPEGESCTHSCTHPSPHSPSSCARPLSPVVHPLVHHQPAPVVHIRSCTTSLSRSCLTLLFAHRSTFQMDPLSPIPGRLGRSTFWAWTAGTDEARFGLRRKGPSRPRRNRRGAGAREVGGEVPFEW